MLTVLFVVGAGERAGAERVLLALARSVDRERVRPVVAFCAEGPFGDEVRDAGVEVVRLSPVPRLRRPAGWRRVVGELRGAIRATGADVVQANGEKMAVFAGHAARAEGVPAVAWLHDAPAGLRRPAALLAQVAMATAPKARVVACAPWLAEAFRRRLRVAATAVPNGIELDRLPPPGSGRARVLAETGFPPDAVVLAHAGRLTPWKGTDVLLDAVARLRVGVGGGRARLLVLGDALEDGDRAWAAGLRDRAAALGLAGVVHFAGYRADALDLVSGADVVVHCATRPDPFPTVVLEGMALGRAVVATRTRGPEEAIDHGRTGLLVRPGDADALAAALATALDDRTRLALGAAAREEAAARFDARRMTAAFEDHWRSLVESGPSRPSRPSFWGWIRAGNDNYPPPERAGAGAGAAPAPGRSR